MNEVEVDLKDKNNPVSLINLLPTQIADWIEIIPEATLAMTEEEIEKHAKPDLRDELLRTSFWMEYNRATSLGKKMNITQVFGGVCTRDQFVRQICSNSWKLAYIVTPPRDFNVSMMEILYKSTEEMRQVLDIPNTYVDEQGVEQVRTNLVSAKMKIWETAQNRVHGSVTQKVQLDSRSVNVNVNQDSAPKSLDELNQRIADAERKLLERKVYRVEKEVTQKAAEEDESGESA